MPSLGAAASSAQGGVSSGGAGAGAGGAGGAGAPATGAATTTPLTQAFWDLAAADAGTRTRAAGGLVKALAAAQAGFDESCAKVAKLAPDASDRPCCHDLAYSVDRLINGLSSSRGAARHGFALALTEVLITFPNVRTALVLEKLYASTYVTKKSSREEQKDGLLGRVFGILALHRAGRLNAACVDATAVAPPGAKAAPGSAAAATAPEADSGSDSEGEDGAAAPATPAAEHNLLTQVLDQLFVVAGKKSWLADVAFEAVAAIVESCGPEAWTATLAGVVNARLATKTRRWSPAHASLALALERILSAWFPGVDLALPAPVTALRAALHPGRLVRYRRPDGDDGEGGAAVADADDEEDVDDEASLEEAYEDGGFGSKVRPPYMAPLARAVLQSTKMYPQIHGWWGHLLQRFVGSVLLMPGAAATSHIPATPAQFAEVWRVYVDELLMTQGPERRATGLSLLASILPGAAHDPVVLTAALSPQMVRVLVANLANKKKLLHAAAAAAIKALLAACAGKPAAAAAALVALMARGHADFDARTHTQTISTLMSQLSDEAILAHMSAAQREFARPSSAPVYSDIASTSTGLTGITGLGLDYKTGDDSASVSGPLDGEDEDAGANIEEEAELDDAGRPRRPRHLTPADTRRLWALDTLCSGLLNAGLAALRTPAQLTRTVAFLAAHASADVEASDETPAELAAAGASPVLKSFATALGLDASAAAPLLVASPPLSGYMRAEVRARLAAVTRALASQVWRQEGDKPKGGAPAAEALAAAAPAWGGFSDRAFASTHLSYTLCATVNKAWDAAAAAADASADAEEDEEAAVVVSSVPPRISLDFGAGRGGGEDDEEGSGDDDSEAGSDAGSEAGGAPALRPSAVRSKALAAAAALEGAASALLAARPGGGNGGGAVEAARALMSFAALLTHVALHLLQDAAPAEVATALQDLLATLPTTLAAPLAAVDAAAKAAAAGGAAASPAAPPASSKKAGKATPAKGAAAASASAAPSALSGLRAALAAAAGNASSPAATSPGGGAAGASPDLLVFTDACLALLANASGMLREAIKGAARHVFNAAAAVSMPVVDAALAVVLRKPAAGAEEEEGGEEDDDHDHDHDHGSSDEDEEDSGAKAGAGRLAGTKRRRESFSDDEEDDDEEDEEGGNEFERTLAKAEAADAGKTPAQLEAEMEAYEALLARMIRLRRRGKVAAKAARARELAFKFRALDLLEVVVARLGSGAPAPAGSPAEAAAVTLLIDVALSLLSAVKTLQARTGGAGGKGSTSAAEAADAALLQGRVAGLLGRLARGRVPSVAGAPGAAVAVLERFDKAIELVLSGGGSPAFSESCAVVASLVQRALRGVGGEGSGATPAAAAANPQPAPAWAPRLAAGYARVLRTYLVEKHSHVSPAFFRPALAHVPVLAVQLLPSLAAAVASGDIKKPFKHLDAYNHMQAAIKTAGAKWSAGVACALPGGGAGDAAPAATASAKKAKKGGAAPAAPAPAAAAAPVTVAAALVDALPAVLGAVRHTLAVSGGSGEAASAALKPKLLREPLSLCLQAVKALAAAAPAAGSAGAKELEATLEAVAAFGAAASCSETNRRWCNAILEAAGRAPVAGQEGGEEEEEREAHGTAMEDDEVAAAPSAPPAAAAAKKDKKKDRAGAPPAKKAKLAHE